MPQEPVPEAVQPERLTETLRRSGALGAGRVRDVRLENARPTILSKVMRLRLQYDGDEPDAPSTLFMKTGLPDRSDPAWTSGRQEVRFYTKLASKVGPGLLPRCYDADWDSQTNQWRLVLEDLSETHALATKWPVPPTFEQCKSVLGTWAAFHAAWWDDPRLGQSIGGWAEPGVRDRHAESFAVQFAAFADRFSDRLSRDRRELFERVFAAGPRLWRRYDTHRNITVVHGDAHFWNCFLPKNPADTIRLFDWDAWRLGLASDDLAYMMAMHWYRERRQQFERPLLDHYHAALLDCGVRGYDRGMLDEDYRRSVLGLIMRPIWQALNDIPAVVWWNNLEHILSAVDDLACRDFLT